MNLLKWNSIEWRLVENRVFRYQKRIYRASQQGNRNLVKNLQRRLIISLDSKLLAVRQVTTGEKGKRTSSVDEKVYLADPDKIKLVSCLKLDGKIKPLKIHAVNNKAKQALCRIALEPEWEARFEQDSYEFRPGRSCHDAIESTCKALSNSRQQSEYQKIILKVYFENYFHRINHQLLLEKLDSDSMIQNQIKTWLKAGILKEKLKKNSFESLVKTDIRNSQDNVISTLLFNIALNGLINYLKSVLISITAENDRRIANQAPLTVIRYASNLIVIHNDLNIIKKAKREIRKWLHNNCKLTLNQEEPKIYNLTQGFDFLGFSLITIRQNGKNRLKVYPSRQSQLHILQNLRKVIQKNRAASSYTLISLLKPQIIGWGNYYRYSECTKVFSKISYYLHQKLRAWAFRVDKRYGRQIVKERYFPSGNVYHFNGISYQDNWILYGKKKSIDGKIYETFLPRLNWIKSKKWVKVKKKKSPYDGDNPYWAVRMASH